MKHNPTFRIQRRSFLAGLGTGAASAFVRPLIAQAQTGTAPQRILVIHRPCGTDTTHWFPTGGLTDWVASPLLSSFSALRNDMVILKGVDCPRNQNWLGDKHGAGMIAMMAPPPADKGTDNHVWPVLPGYTVAQQNDTNAKFFTSTDKTFEQLMLEKIAALKGAPIPSVQLTSSLESADSTRDCCLRVVSYSKTDPAAAFPTPLWPESRASVAFMNIFGRAPTGMDPVLLARIQAQNKSVLDYISDGLTSLRGRLPASQLPKLDAHLTAVRDLEKNLGVVGGSRQCVPPTLATLGAPPAGISQLDSDHYQSTLNHLQIIKTMFQCDLTRVASFTFGYGNSEIRFSNVLKIANLLTQYKDLAGNAIVDTEGHHNVSHNGGTGYKEAQYIIDKFYCDMTAKLLVDMKNTPDGAGPGSLLDNTLVVLWNECSDGAGHGTGDMPVLVFGGKFLNLQGGKFLDFGKNGRYMSGGTRSSRRMELRCGTRVRCQAFTVNTGPKRSP